MNIKNWLFPELRADISDDFKGFITEHSLDSDKVFFRISVIQAIISVALVSLLNGTWLIGTIGSLVLVAFSYFLYKKHGGTLFGRIGQGITVALFMGLYIQQGFGVTEMHFHFFLMSGTFLFYLDNKPLIAFGLTATVHHALFLYCQSAQINIPFTQTPIMLFQGGAKIETFIIHALWVVATLALYSFLNSKNFHQVLKGFRQSEELEKLNNEILNVVNSKKLSERIETDGLLPQALNKHFSFLQDLFKSLNTESDSITSVQTQLDSSSVDLTKLSKHITC